MKTYKICLADSFKEFALATKPTTLNQQLPMEGIDPPPLTTLFQEQTATNELPFDQYFIEHEKVEQAPGRTGNMQFQHYIHRYAIRAYHHPALQLLLLTGKKKAISDLIRQADLTLKVKPLFLDLNKVQEALDRVHMVCFRFFEGQFSSTSFHGENVKNIVEQQDLFRRGRISTMSFTLKIEGRPHPMLLSQDGTVVLQSMYESAVAEVQTLHHLFVHYLSRSLSGQSLMNLQPQWKDEILEDAEDALDSHSLYGQFSPA